MASSREARLTDAYTLVLGELLCELYEGVEATPGRAARAMIEMTSGYIVDVPGLFTTFESEGYDEMIVERGIPFTSLCEHHMLPFTGTAAIGYVPNGRVVGLSKLTRVVRAYAQRLQIQERMTVQVADAIEEHLRPQGVIVVVEAEHSCMSCRGVKVPGVTAITSAVRGLLKDDARARAEGLALIRGR